MMSMRANIIAGEFSGASLVKRFGESETGATAVEYSLIAGVIALAIITAVAAIGVSLSEIFSEVDSGFED